ncbi:MAG TPA: tRNA (adenosine(37)-N6)-threonylcarbamoyltransferase complex ATPase subunit type 1 TsaE [Caldilineae bacterium]|nr:tRNA (adenosine(37)-N6)-threonylcarbamoyltransferase complex ATPase subunit type 1 TsaE [Caldilineae bacterium]
MSVTFYSDSPETTRSWAIQLAARLQAPVVVALYGDLGAGKTLVAQAIAAALGVTGPVTSPTFTLINEYDLSDGGILFHVDCYRLQNPEAEAVALGLTELFDQGVVLIEWADRIASLLPDDRIDVVLQDAGPGHRRIEMTDRRFVMRET